ncbi:MAG: rod shape-determining protein MreC, partial [Acidimicrobiaceae bacterium]|nr:rod shape-determining protein MreC [Acidimicrobiaceae bacterium]
ERGDASGVLDKVRSAATDALAPVQSASDRVLHPVGDFFAGALHYGDLKAENKRLRDEIAKNQGDRIGVANAERENQALKDQQKLDFVGDIPTVAATVVSTTASNFDLTVELDRGTDAGVAKDMPVVAAAGLVGRVVQVSRTRSVVVLITDPGSSVGVKLVDTNDYGVATGTGPGEPLRVDFVDPGADHVVKPDESIVTSGLQQARFPPGIPVGKVTTATTPPGAVQQDIAMRPAVDLGRLQFVKVLQWSAGSTVGPAPGSR